MHSSSHKVRTCFHVQDEVSLSPMVSIYCSALKDVKKYDWQGVNTVDFGLYADYSWEPYSRNEFINWPDFRAPKYPEIAVAQISDALLKADTQIVEIGCIGGHGRTGTILACMAIKEKYLTPDESIDFVRTYYCEHAVETRSQVDFIDFFWRSFNV